MPATEPVSPSPSARPTASIGSWWILGLVCAAQFMVVLDVSVVNVALPSIRTALGFDPVDLQWVAGSYALTFAGLLLLGGRLADLYGRRRVFLIGLAVFTLASLVGGLAQTPATLVAARAAQGLGAAVLAPATLTILTTTYAEGPRRTWALAIWTALSSVGGAAGNLVGGLITQSLSWRWILLINVPIGVAAMLLARWRLPAGRSSIDRASGGLDVPGAITATLGVTALTYAVSQADARGWGDPLTLLALAVGVLALGAFVVIERRTRGVPLVPPRLFRRRTVAVGNAIMLLAGACFQIPMWYFLTLYMQDVLHYSAFQTGLAFLPHTLLGLVIGIRVTPWLMRRIDHRRLILIGALLNLVGFAWQSRITPDSGYVGGILGPAILLAVGGALFFTPATSAVTAGVPAADAGAASGLMNAAKQVGGALGLAVLLLLTGGGATLDGANPSEEYAGAFVAISAILAAIAALSLALPPRRDSETADG